MNVKRRQSGFTLIELMIVVAIIGILSAVAIPSFLNYIKKSKTAEALSQLQKISVAAKLYYAEEHRVPADFSPIPPQFPATIARTPIIACCANPGNKCPPDTAEWGVPTWKALKFAMEDPHYFRYAFTSSGIENDAEFTAFAHADLDCDGQYSTFTTQGEANFLGNDITAGGTVSRIRELE